MNRPGYILYGGSSGSVPPKRLDKDAPCTGRLEACPTFPDSLLRMITEESRGRISLVEKERTCCATLGFTIREQAGSISLFIDGRAGDRKGVDDLAARVEASKGWKSPLCRSARG